MAVITPPDLTIPPIEELAATDEILPPMNPRISTALTTRSPLTIPELLTAFAFFRDFEQACVAAGPFFSALNHKEAGKMKVLAWDRLKAAREAKRLETVTADDPDLHVQLPVGR